MEIIQKELARLLSISTRQVRNLKAQGLFEFIPNTKKYDDAKCILEYIDFKIKAEMGNGTTVIKEREQAEHERLKKEITQIKLRKLRKEVHEATDVEAFLNEMLLNFRARLLAIPGKIAPQIIGETDVNVIIKALTEEVEQTLNELSEYDPDIVNGENGTDITDDLDYEEDGEC